MSLIKAAGAGEQSTGFYKHLLDQSLKFNDADSPYLHRTPASQGSLTTFTFSFWYKRSKLGTYQEVLHVYPGSGERSQILFMNNDTLKVELEAGNTNHFLTNMLFRDTSAWYHVVVTFDSTNGTQANRVKIYVNGVDQSGTGGGGFSTANYPSQNATSGFNTTSQHEISTYDGSDYHLDGYLAEVNFIDGTALTADSFGETKDGIWIPKDTSGLTFGTNGFHLTFKDDVVSEGFNTVTYRGTGAAQSVSGIGFEPSLIWVKRRDSASYGNKLYDAVRGFSQELTVDATDGEYNLSGRVTGHSDGFDLGTYAGVNESGGSLVAWCWEAGGTPTATNSAGAGATPTAGSVKIDGSNLGSALAGTIPATRLSADTSKGFSVVTYTGTGSAGTVAHGLGAAPKWIIAKRRNAADDWYVYHTSLGESAYLTLNSSGTGETSVSYPWNGTAPTSSVFSVNSAASPSSSGTMVAYCWAEISGYSSFGTYSGSGSSGKSVTGLGFKPAWLMIKSSAGATNNWNIYDNTRQPTNPRDLELYADDTAAEYDSGRNVTFTDDGFDLDTVNYVNNSGVTYIYMAFADTREAAFFKDVTTNGNHFTPVNLDYRDSVPDVPTNSFCTLNPLDNDSMTLSNGNLTGISPANAHNGVGCTFGVTGGKWYWEVRSAGTGSNFFFGMAKSTFQFISQYTNDAFNFSDIWGVATDGQKFGNGSGESSYGSALSSGDILQLAFDLDNGKFYAGKNGTYFNSGDPAGGTNAAFTNVPTGESMQPFYGSSTSGVSHTFNFGQDSSFAGNHATANSNADGNGHGSFAYAPPSGYLALCSQNLPDAAIIDGTENFNTVLYTGNESTRSITGVGFSPDFLWIKGRSTDQHHNLYDALRSDSDGPRRLYSSLTAAEESTVYSGTTNVSSLDADGFTMGNGTSVNENSKTFVAWNWLAGTAFSNDASATGVGTIDSEGQVNATAGFSIISYTGIGSAGTVAHGLGATPTAIIVKNRDQADKWVVYHEGQNASPATGYLSLNETSAFGASSSVWNDTAPTSTVFSVGTGGSVNASSEKYIAYCFTDIEGYSKHGSYVGNGNADGPFVYTGFRPAWVMQKKSNNTGHWHMWDSTRNTSNEVTRYFSADDSSAEATDGGLDILSNGFKPRKTGTGLNASGDTYIYLAFAEQPFKFANAR